MTYGELEECESHLAGKVQQNQYIGQGGDRTCEVLLLELAFGGLELLLELRDLQGEVASEFHEHDLADLVPHNLLLLLRPDLGCFSPALGQCCLKQ